MIRLRNVSKSYKKTPALSDFSYDFDTHRGYGILGINGAGKSTLIGCITDNLSHTGEIETKGLHQTEIGYVPQELAIYPELSVMDNLLFFGALHKMNPKTAKERAKELIERTLLSGKEKALAGTLSGGMKRKLNLITGLIHNPKVLICDEVCVGIDPLSRREILDYLKEIQDEGIQILYTSHYMDEVEFLCDRILFLHKGKLILEGDTAELVRQIAGETSDLMDLFEKVLRERPDADA